MPDRLTITQLRERAREHRLAAERVDDPIRRKAFMTISIEYERLADAMEQNQKQQRSGQ